MQDYSIVAHKVLSKVTTQEQLDKSYRTLCSAIDLHELFIERNLDCKCTISQINEEKEKVRKLFKAFATQNNLIFPPELFAYVDKRYQMDKKWIENFNQIVLTHDVGEIYATMIIMFFNVSKHIEKHLLSPVQISLYLVYLKEANNWCDKNNKPRLGISLT